MTDQQVQYLALIEYAGDEECIGIFCKPSGLAIAGISRNKSAAYGYRPITKDEYETYLELGIPIIPFRWHIVEPRESHQMPDFQMWLEPHE